MRSAGSWGVNVHSNGFGTFSSERKLEVFTAGMALALSVLPESAVEAIDQVVGEG